MAARVVLTNGERISPAVHGRRTCEREPGLLKNLSGAAYGGLQVPLAENRGFDRTLHFGYIEDRQRSRAAEANMSARVRLGDGNRVAANFQFRGAAELNAGLAFDAARAVNGRTDVVLLEDRASDGFLDRRGVER